MTDVEVIQFELKPQRLIYDFMMVSLSPNSLSLLLLDRFEWISGSCCVGLHDGAAAGFGNAAALAGLAARVLDWLWLDDGGNAGGGGRHFAVDRISDVAVRYGSKRRTMLIDDLKIICLRFGNEIDSR